MAIIQNRVYTGTTSTSKDRPMTCHTCKEKKTGVFGMDSNGRPCCFDCLPEADKAIYRQDEDDRGS